MLTLNCRGQKGPEFRQASRKAMICGSPTRRMGGRVKVGAGKEHVDENVHKYNQMWQQQQNRRREQQHRQLQDGC